MNRKSNIRLLTRMSLTAALSVGLTAFSTGAAAADTDIGARIATGVGQIIAAQGNAALMEIREELGDTLKKTVDSFLPPAQPQAASPSTAPHTPDTAAL